MRRYERASTLLTSNRTVDDWGKPLGDTTAVTRTPRSPAPPRARPQVRTAELAHEGAHGLRIDFAYSNTISRFPQLPKFCALRVWCGDMCRIPARGGAPGRSAPGFVITTSSGRTPLLANRYATPYRQASTLRTSHRIAHRSRERR